MDTTKNRADRDINSGHACIDGISNLSAKQFKKAHFTHAGPVSDRQPTNQDEISIDLHCPMSAFVIG